MNDVMPRRGQDVVIGVDVGGTKIAAAIVDSRGEVSEHLISPTITTDPQSTLDSISTLIKEIIGKGKLEKKDIRGIGLGIPGLVDPIKGIGIASVNLQWQDVPVADELYKRLGIHCYIENDVRAAALGEIRYGKGKGLSNLIFLNIGTGVAAAIVLDGKIFRGQNGMAGEIGHAVVDIHGPRCKCGGYGCLEAIISGPAIIQRYQEKLSSDLSSASEFQSHQDNKEVTIQDLYQAAFQGEVFARQTVEEVSLYLANAIQFLSLAYDPQRIILGGGVAYASPFFLQYLLQAIKRLAENSWVFRRLLKPDFIQITQLGVNSGILGAAALVP